ncbi:TetR/AcrR family transcriptional regulator [Paenibacillus sp. NEAU-GSW1]|uniref:TetR/AcrR family transcriptional regulator n=1 Tax=Paenibacillus sp. NEAU-GSW1 TaxID=2682486 RepID=UPI0012E0E6AC|nr:TetR/AcrR family transcriptional regulator [Paenibacillus sp. NEAU-GSW1]MUT66505.1 TetR family transcriptional regulator [Paenibacillus sp. NEAU-GSW1]
MDPRERYEKERQDGKQNRQQNVLEAAARIFAVKGIEKTTMQDVAREASVGIATLFRYFPKKEKLIVAVATMLLGPMLERFQSVAALPHSSLKRLDALLDTFIRNDDDINIKVLADFENYSSHSPEPLEDMQAYNELHRDISRAYSRIIQDGMRDGSIRTDLDVRDVLTTVMNTFGLFSKNLSLQQNIPLLESDLESDKQLAILKRILLDYVQAR